MGAEQCVRPLFSYKFYFFRRNSATVRIFAILNIIRFFLLSFRCFFFPFGSILNFLFGLNRNGLRNTIADNLDVSVIMFQRKFVFLQFTLSLPVISV